ncbi:MAG: response regulator, partial [Thermodesulfobacteriota bacterium]|nr:response regulator [Thermodesulfobacteriota bacterium]
TRLRQIITNLMGNAVKFIEEGEITVTVENSRPKAQHDGENIQDDDAVEMLFSVKDTGIGIPEDKLERIFDSFNQVDGSTTRKYGGTGLGLTISRRLCRLMGGDMWVESPAIRRLSIADLRLEDSPEIGKLNGHKSSNVVGRSVGGPGSTFYFTARFKKDPESHEVINPVDVSRLKGRRVLIVDDSENSLKIVSDIVKKAGMIPVPARTGEEALQYLQLQIDNGRFEHPKRQSEDASGVESSIEIAIIDIVMPGMSGFDLAVKISDLTGKRTKMIALSSDVAMGAAAKTKMSGFSGFVSKPVRRRGLIDLIRTVLGLREVPPANVMNRHRIKEILSHDVRVLYAEDNPVNQQLGQKMLERMGYDRVEIAADGLEAVKAVKENGPYDIILMDIQMPNMDGLEATKKIREMETDRTSIIALTANAMKGDREACLYAGMDDYLAKPFKREELQRLIRQWMHRKREDNQALAGKRILIVEDEEKMRKSIIRLFKKRLSTARLVWAEDGIDAGAKLGSFMPDVIVTDIMMPRMDGAEFIRYVRNTPRYANTGVIVITGLHREDPRVRAVRQARVDKVLYKPWENEDLILAIKEVVL